MFYSVFFKTTPKRYMFKYILNQYQTIKKNALKTIKIHFYMYSIFVFALYTCYFFK